MGHDGRNVSVPGTLRFLILLSIWSPRFWVDTCSFRTRQPGYWRVKAMEQLLLVPEASLDPLQGRVDHCHSDCGGWTQKAGGGDDGLPVRLTQ